MPPDPDSAPRLRSLGRQILAVALYVGASAEVPVNVECLTAPHTMVVAGHPEAAEAGVAVLRAGGNAVDAAVAVSLSLGVAEPFASGLGGKLVLLYYEAATQRVHVIEAMDAASDSLPVRAFLAQTEHERMEGGPSVAVPGLPAGLWLAHQRWGVRPWADNVAPARALAERGALVLPKTVELFAESRARFEHDPEASRLYLPGGKLPVPGTRLPNTDLARTLARYATEGPPAIYRGDIADALVSTVRRAGGYLTRDDLVRYRVRESEPLAIDFAGGRLYSTPSPTSGGATVLAVLATLETASWAAGPLHSVENIDRLGRAFHAVYPAVNAAIGDTPGADRRTAGLLTAASIAGYRERAAAPLAPVPLIAETGSASTTHFVVVDSARNIICATQSLSFHFGCGLVAPGTGILLNNSLSNFSTDDPAHPNYAAPGRRPRSTIAPVLWLDAAGRPRLAVGLPGGQRIPTALAQVLIDATVFHRPLADAIGDTRLHFLNSNRGPVLQCETGLPTDVAEALARRGWSLQISEPAGTGLHFGGVNAVEFTADGALRGLADSRRTNAARGN
jgi:gamma-glutamyltranspeptidase/glutathione hydrolase